MSVFSRFKNKLISIATSYSTTLSKQLISSYAPLAFIDIPWTQVKKPLSALKIALVTTAGIHHQYQKPFDMHDPSGDPSFRKIDPKTIEKDFKITHDYYDHRDADKDLNIVFPVTRLKEMAAAGIIGSVAERHYSFMGHITGSHIEELIKKSAPTAAADLLQHNVDAVLLTPG